MIFNSLLFIALLAIIPCSDDNKKEEPIPVGDEWIDPVFAQVLQQCGYITDAKNVTPLDVADLEEIDVSGSYEDRGPIKSVRGIEQFTSLKDFQCSSNQLTNLDVTKNIQLTSLSCSNNELTNLDVSKNTQLTALHCDYNGLTHLDVTKNTRLTALHCDYNGLTNLDVTKNSQLTTLYCGSNGLTNLDVTKNTQLIIQYCSNNPGTDNKFIVTAWLDSSAIPYQFTAGEWDYNGQIITIEYVQGE